MKRYHNYKDINIISNPRGEVTKKCEEENNKKKNKFDFNQKKNNTICSLNEVEHFLCDLKSLGKYIKLYYLFK